jgi:lipopolysaccharide export system protein LptC
MKKTLFAVLLAAIGAAAWFGVVRDPVENEVAEALPEERPNFEAQGVVLRQLNAEGKLQYELEAERIVQQANGDVTASSLSFNHQPRPDSRGKAQRWNLTAETGEFPAQGNVVRLSGKVRAEGRREGDARPLVVIADALQYDMEQDLVTVEGEANITDGRNDFIGRDARVNIATGVVTVESGHGKISL